jgi:hypothetical protein
MGKHWKGKTVTDKTSREILDAIDLAVKETAIRAASGNLEVVAGMLGPRPAFRRRPSAGPDGPRPRSSREILDAIDRGLRETRRALAEAAADGTPGTAEKT